MPPKPPAPIPDTWRQDVIRVLRSGSSQSIEWTGRARLDWSLFGLNHEAYDLLIRTLLTPGLIGREVPLIENGAQTWEFLCDHPFGVEKPLYAKIALRDGQLRIKIFSTHVDLSGDLLAAIKKYSSKKR